jgi:hypothetical protein
VINISISDIPNQARCFSITPLYFGEFNSRSLSKHFLHESRSANNHAAGKHISGIVWKTRVWVLLDNIQIELGYHTRTKVEALQRRLEPTSRK